MIPRPLPRRALLIFFMQTVKFFTLGCKVNQYDTQSIREQLLRRGLKELTNKAPADIYLINTCTVTHRSDAGSLYLIRKALRENPKAKVMVAGCLTKLDSDKIRKTSPDCLIVKDKDNLAPIFKKLKIFPHLSPVYRTLNPETKFISHFHGRTRAFLKIQDGCDNFCSYCKVPLVRGKPRSRKIEDIIQEAQNLAKNDFKEIVLCGICLGSFGRGLYPAAHLVDLLKKLEKIKGILRIRLSSIEAGDLDSRLIKYMAASKKLCRHLHIPLQSGDDEILKKMNRRYTGKTYLRLIEKIKNSIPDIAITTDVLVGFPGETESSFRNTLSLIKKIQPEKTHIFPYSPRRGTAALRLPVAQVSASALKTRIAALRSLADSCSFAYKKKFLGQTREVLFQARAKDKIGWWQGFTENYLKVLFKSGKNLKNCPLPVKLIKIDADYLIASS